MDSTASLGQQSEMVAAPLGGDMSERAADPGSGQDRRFAVFAVACAAATLVMCLADTVGAPPAQRPGQAVVTALLGATVLAGVWFLRRGFTPRILMAAGATLMVLGVAAGVWLPDSLDAALVLPLAGAVLALPAVRGRPLLILLAVAFGASMVGETVGTVGTGTGGSGFAPRQPAVDSRVGGHAGLHVWPAVVGR